MIVEERIRLDRIAIRNFRNLERVDLDLPPDGAVIVGDNGHGKTNLLEAIYYLQIMRSIRDARDQDLTRFDATGFHISAHAHTPEEREISVGFDRGVKRKKVSIDGTEVRRLSDALEIPEIANRDSVEADAFFYDHLSVTYP